MITKNDKKMLFYSYGDRGDVLMLKLVTPTIFYKKKYLEYMKSWNDEIINRSITPIHKLSYTEREANALRNL